MKNKASLIVLIFTILLSIAGWLNYARFVYITSIDPDLTIPQYDEKYFSQYPDWMNGINESNITTISILSLAIILMIFFVTMMKKIKPFPIIIFILNGLIILMLGMAYM